jgi:hypothetical protein
MLTAISTVLGFIPIAPTVFWGPMAFAIMGGLFVATMLGVVAEERLPTLRWGFPVPCHVFGDRRLTNVDAELEEFSMDPGSTRQREKASPDSRLYASRIDFTVGTPEHSAPGPAQ